ncbi:Pentatricopeptide repeat-containing protein [Actinidia chinensis var. chinensis]|uniref:Pentatricopeptide repeat-containing protein n=1 Tax=Actinidia chinensis var. chinensis TaxID=1590841 RepID=A0A2R6QVC9_ACTCC|nr:Pentatricopeptide repeat-containing protein [Actinidia chinensis var. chinensis]
MRSRFPSLSTLSLLHSSIHKLPLLLHTHHLRSQCHHLTPPFSSSSAILTSCKDLQTLKKAHASFIISNGFEPVSVASKLIYLYSQFCDLEGAVSVFETVQEPNTFIWNAIIKAHVDLGIGDSAFSLYRQMRNLNIEHDGFTFPVLNRAVLLLQNSVLYGGFVHCLAIKMGFESDLYFCNTMIDVYVKSGCIGYACQVFVEMSQRDLVSWTSMISGYVYEGNIIGAFRFFEEMRLELEPGPVTVVIMLQVCCSHGSVIEGRQLHGFVIKRGFLIEGSLQNSILKMYANTGRIDDAEDFFSEIYRDVVSWNILISSYISIEDVMEVAKCFNKMQGEVRPSIETLTLVISASANSRNLLQGENLHCFAIKSRLYDTILQTSLLHFYAKCGELKRSAQMFSEIPFKNSITWSAMMSGLTEGGYFEQAIELFRQIRDSDLKPVAEMFNSLVVVYTHLGALKLGKGIHAYLIKNSFCNSEGDNAQLETAILNMYVRCGSISYAKTCFDRTIVRDLVAWTSMIEGCGAHGLGLEALQLFHQMVAEGVEPNGVTFLSLLSACSHSGLLMEGCGVFFSMKWRFGNEPDLNDYTCIVDLLGRSGKLKEALAIILKLVAFPDGRIWGALLAASRVHGNQKFAEYAAQRLLELEHDNAGYYTLISNVQALVERWDDVEEVRRRMKDDNLTKKPGWSCIEAKGSIHGFVSGDRSHPRMVEIYETVEVLSRKIHEIGCILGN